ncbi:MAG TPA: tetratricopeptide repeat protein [Gemmataceae bacterium]|nr:tetratricopeptide repeat protein [Gemmataceae bacterium]
MTDAQPLAMLALRRVHSRAGVAAGVGFVGADDADGEFADAATLTSGDRVALGRILRQAIDHAWLTVDLLCGPQALRLRLDREEKEALEAVLGNGCFDHLTSIPAPDRKAIWRELGRARKSGPLSQADLDVEELLRQLGGLTRPADPRALRDLEWYALWQLASDLAREGYGELRPLFEARTPGGESLLVGLVTSFLTSDLELEGEPYRADLALSVLPDEHVRWLCEQSERLQLLLDDAYAGIRQVAPAETAARVRQGLAFAQQGEYERAVVEFTAAIQFDPTAAAYVHRGDALRLRGEYERAIADYGQALRLDANHLLAHLNRGLVNRLTGRPEAAIADLTEALRLEPRNVVALNGRGAAHADLGRYDLAIADHTEALRLDPSLAWAYQSRGDAYSGRREYDQAIADYTQALRLNPHFLLAHANRGNAYRLAGDLDRAVADFTESLRLDPLNPRIYTSRGDTYRRQERYDLALADYGEAIRLDPTNPTVYLNRGIAYQLAGEYDRAVASFDQAEQFDAANPEVFYQRAQAHRYQESYDKAIADLGRVIELNPRDAVAYVSRGTLHTLKRQLPQAIADFNEAVRLDPTSAQARMERGRVQAMRGAFDDALADCAEALRIDAHFVPARLIRGGVFIRTGKFEAALEECSQAIKTNPRYARAYNDRGVAHSRLGQLDAAIQDFTRAIELAPEYVQALSNRGNAYQLQHRHAEALRDFAGAVVVDSKYASAYCVQRGLVEVGRGNHRQALADYAVALAIDPKNRAARAARAEARGYINSDFVLTVATDAPAPAPSEPVEAPPSPAESTNGDEVHSTLLRGPAPPTQVIDLTDVAAESEIVDLSNPETAAEEDSDIQSAAAAETQLAPAPAADQSDYEAEQERLRELRHQAQLRALAEKADEIRARNKAEDARRKEFVKKQKAKKAWRDPDEVAAQWRKRKQYAIICVGALFIGYWLFQGIWALIPRAKNPFQTYSAEQLVGEYARDAVAADEKFADHTVCIHGKLAVITDKQLKLRNLPPRVFFDVPGQKEDLRIECQFDDPEMALGLNLDNEYWIVGKVQKYKAGKGITLKEAVFLTIRQGKAAAGPLPSGVRLLAGAPPGSTGLVLHPDEADGRGVPAAGLLDLNLSSITLCQFTPNTRTVTTQAPEHTPRVVGCWFVTWAYGDRHA